MDQQEHSHALKTLRQLMLDTNFVPEALDAYIIPYRDAHNSEYLADRDKRIQYISGFTGSNGCVVITMKHALLWTCSRYFEQAERQLSDLWTLMKEGIEGYPKKNVWLERNLPLGSCVGVDPFLISSSDWITLRDELASNANIRLLPVSCNLVDIAWPNQPLCPDRPVLPHFIEFAGQTWQQKIDICRQKMLENNAGCLIIFALDEIAWLFNIRGSDIDYNPLFFAYAAIEPSKVFLFINESQISQEVKNHLHLNDDGIYSCEIRPYTAVGSYIEEYLKSMEHVSNGVVRKTSLSNSLVSRIWMPKGASQGLVSFASDDEDELVKNPTLVRCVSPVCLLKLIKNDIEIKGFISSHIRDAAAMCCYFAWLEVEVPMGNVTEISGADQLQAFRKEMVNFVGLSFPTISGSGPNGSVIHYVATPDTCRVLSSEELYLVDSGAQYKDGTTDVTRTVHFGTPTDFERDCFTRVLQGHIRLARAVFPSKIVGNYLDSFARQSLWEVGLDYAHGTGHGVGSFLNVHEGPIGISWRPYPDDPGLQAGMVVSNEPGFYVEGKFGIRIENLSLIVKAPTKNNFQNKDFLTFEQLTLVPIQLKLVEPLMLSRDEISYLNSYHELCREKVAPLLREMGKVDALAWLYRETEPIG